MRKAVGRSVAVIVALVSMVAALFVGTGAARMAYADTTSSNLKDFLTSVDISGITPDAQGVYHYRKGQEVALNFVFAEKGSGKLQFDNNSPLTYDLPKGFETLATNGTFNIDIETADGVKTVQGNTWEVKDGKLVIKFNSADPNYTTLLGASNVKIPVSLRFKLTDNISDVDFGAEVHKKFEIDNTNNLTSQKSGWYDAATGRIHYRVTVSSTGENTNVHVKDLIGGTALTYDPSSFKVSGNSSAYSGGTSSNGFDITFPSMKDGETTTITYDAVIDYTKINPKEKATFDETKNTVTTHSDEHPTPHEEHKDFEHQIEVSSVSKSGQASDKTTSRGGGEDLPLSHVEYRRQQWQAYFPCWLCYHRYHRQEFSG